MMNCTIFGGHVIESWLKPFSCNGLSELEVTVTCDQESGHRLKQAIVDATRGGVLFME